LTTESQSSIASSSDITVLVGEPSSSAYQLTIDVATGRDAGTIRCEKAPDRGSPADRACANLATGRGEEARDGLMKLFLIYLLGVWFAVEHLLKKRWPNRFANL
jgi:hypothetical protein